MNSINYTLWIAFASFILSCSSQESQESKRLNIILVMVDDLGYGDLGAYGQTEIKTPNLDRMAKEGMKFTDFYSGSPVCAPSRSVLMTGLHTGHTTVRGNFGTEGIQGIGGGKGFRVPLKDDDFTLAEAMKYAGYTTAATGKWGLGEPGTEGVPNKQGFDEWFGFLNQRRAHDHYGEFIWKNTDKYLISENTDSAQGVYTHDLFTDFGLDFIEQQSQGENPFFLYMPYLLPHNEYQIPEIDPEYVGKDWTEEEKIYASMVTLIDRDMGKIRSKLEELGITENTLLIFTSDNGPAERWRAFNSAGIFKGRKRDVYEGGIRVPLIVTMLGTILSDQTNGTVGYQADLMPTLMDIVGITSIDTLQLDGVSLKKALYKNEVLENDRVLYWEFHEQEGKQAVRLGKWKAVRLDVHEKGFHDDIELYDLEADPAESTNISTDHPDIVSEMKTIMENEHVPSTAFPFRFEID